MSVTGLAIIYIIIWWIVFFAILPIDVNRLKTVKIEGEDPGSPENPKMVKNGAIKETYIDKFSNNLRITLLFPTRFNDTWEAEINLLIWKTVILKKVTTRKVATE